MKQEVKQNKRVISLDKNTIEYSLIKSRRKTVQIMIFPPGKIEVRAPLYASLKNIEDIIFKKGQWIEKKLRDFKNRPDIATENIFSKGSGIRHLGKVYSLEITKAVKNQIQFRENIILIKARNEDSEYIRKLFDKWVLKEANALFLQLIKDNLLKMKSYKVKEPTFTIRRMKTRWGSCSTSGKISLNFELMKYPVEFIDYVVAHELSHLVEHNHSKKFYRVLESFMPDWKARKNLSM